MHEHDWKPITDQIEDAISAERMTLDEAVDALSALIEWLRERRQQLDFEAAMDQS